MVSISLTSTSGVFRYGKGQKNAGGHVEASAGEEDDGIGMKAGYIKLKTIRSMKDGKH